MYFRARFDYRKYPRLFAFSCIPITEWFYHPVNCYFSFRSHSKELLFQNEIEKWLRNKDS